MLMRRVGYQIVRANYYSPIPEIKQLPASVWDEAAPIPGLELDLDAQVETIDRDLATHLAEFDPPWDPPGNEEGSYLTFVPGVVRRKSVTPPMVLRFLDLARCYF